MISDDAGPTGQEAAGDGDELRVVGGRLRRLRLPGAAVPDRLEGVRYQDPLLRQPVQGPTAQRVSAAP